MDEESTELVKVATEGGVRAFLETVCGPLTELSNWGADVIRSRRFTTQVKMLQRARDMLETAGLTAHAVPAQTLVPLLELGSLHDDADEEMHERWAALLANAAGEQTADVMPSFPRILSELVPEEARMLEWLTEQSGGSTLHTFKSQVGFDPTRSTAEQPLFDVYVDNLERLQLIAVSRSDARQDQFQREVADRIRTLNPDRFGRPGPRIHTPRSGDHVSVTQLGRAFVAACTSPTGLDAEWAKMP